MAGVSKREMEIMANLEFDKKHFFTVQDIKPFVENKTQRYNVVKNLLRKKRIVKLNRRKYYLIPVRAKAGKWSEHPFIVADEACDSESYFIGGWSAAHYWKLTDQVPMQVDVYTTKRQGEMKVLSTRVVFHRTTKTRIERVTVEKTIGNHTFKIMNKEESKKWLKSHT
jgi:predicted transcriptional regulator of viral defense system